jgi:type I restriction enzyme, S subunit
MDSIPHGWKVVRFDDFTTLQRGKDLTKSHFKSGNIPVAGSNGVIGYHDESFVKAPGVTVGRSGSCGKVNFYAEDFWAHNTSLYVRDYHGNDERFASYLLEFLDLSRFRTGASVPTLDRNSFKELPIAVPEVDEQRRIAHVLTTAQATIEQQARLIALMRELKSALMRKLFTEGLRHEKQKETEIGPVPESWNISALREFAHEVTDFSANGSFAGLRENVEYSDKEDYAILLRLLDHSNKFSKDFVYVNKHAYDFLKKSWLAPRSVIVSNIGARLGTVFRAPNLNKPMTLGPNALVVRAGEDDDYVYYWLQSEQAQKYMKSITSVSAQPKFTKTEFRNTPVLVPDKNERGEIALFLSTVDTKIELLKEKRIVLEDLFHTLLHRLMTGQTRANEIDLLGLS